MWSETLLILASFFAILLLIRKLRSSGKVKIISYLLPVSLIIFASDSFLQVSSHFASFKIWVVISATIISLVFLLLVINELKPDHLQYPDIYNFIPFLALPIFYLLMETGSLLNIVVILLQGTGLVVLLLFSLIYASDSNQPAILITGVILLLGAFIFNWFGQLEEIYIQNIVYSSIGVASMFLAYSLPPIIDRPAQE